MRFMSDPGTPRALAKLVRDIKVRELHPRSGPLWQEARIATELGEALALHYGVPFHFPSPREPDDDCPTWFEQDSAVRCND
jgi:hypothetical protein